MLSKEIDDIKQFIEARIQYNNFKSIVDIVCIQLIEKLEKQFRINSKQRLKIKDLQKELNKIEKGPDKKALNIIKCFLDIVKEMNVYGGYKTLKAIEVIREANDFVEEYDK